MTKTLLLVALLFVCFHALVNDSKVGATKEGDPRIRSVKYPTMLDMTSPEFGAAVAKSDIALLPVGAIEEHGSHLPLGTDAVSAVAQVFYVQQYLRKAGVETIIGPPLNIGITNEANDRSRDGTYMYPGSLTIGEKTFVSLYVDVLRSMHDNGIRRVFVYSGHLGGRHLEAIVKAVDEANKSIDGMKVYAFIESERLEQMKLKPNVNILPIEKGQNFEMLTRLLGVGQEQAFSTHGDGTETSLMLYFQPDGVRPGYQRVPQSPSSKFFDAIFSGDPAKNPAGTGGFPYEKATASVGEKITDYRTPIIGDAVLKAIGRK